MEMRKEKLQFERNLVIKLHKKGYKKAEILEISELKESAVKHLIAAYNKFGDAAVKLQKWGRKVGEQRRLTPEQEKQVQKALVDKDPNQFKIKCCVWDRVTVSLLIKQLFGIEMPLSTIGYYFQRWGFTAQRPNLTNYKQNPRKVADFLEKEYPAIKEKAGKENAEILWGDETAIQNECNYVKSYAPKGQTPTLKTTNERIKTNMISAISNRGKLRFMFFDGTMTSQKFIAFLERLIRYEKRKLFFIVDNLKVHHSKKVQKWLDKHTNQIEVYYLPSYSPELNPDEYLNGNLKRNIAKNRKVSNVSSLRQGAKSIMLNFRKDKDHVKSWFGNKHIRYAA